VDFVDAASRDPFQLECLSDQMFLQSLSKAPENTRSLREGVCATDWLGTGLLRKAVNCNGILFGDQDNETFWQM
jgi:hypothetical protein